MDHELRSCWLTRCGTRFWVRDASLSPIPGVHVGLNSSTAISPLMLVLTRSVTRSYPQGICSKTPRGCLKPWVVQNPMYTIFSPIHAYQ